MRGWGQRMRPMYNGCKHHKDCFTCPFDDCIADNNLWKKESRPVRTNHEGGSAKTSTNIIAQRKGESQG